MPSRFSSSKGPSQRQLRAGELVRHALVEILQREDLRDPALHGVSITVTEVRMSPDLKQANVYCAPLGASIDKDRHPEIFKALDHAAPHLRHLLGRKIDMKFTPALKFRSDESFAEARRIDELLASPAVARDLKHD
ncbi:MAG: 30S ribosome-binding factor RbfA [Parvularculaceae bacterium]|nr:30S ribosome-binding factor RbfA [Parvularculaceae bacterium]